TNDLVPASIGGIQERYGVKYVSPELYLGTQVGVAASGAEPREALGLVRGVTQTAPLVRRQFQLVEGRWPEPGEVIIGRLAKTKLGADETEVAVGETIQLESRAWKIVGEFSCGGAAFESEIWCRLDDLQQAMKRQDLSIVAMTLKPGEDFAELDMFCKQRLDLELQTMRETDYYATLQRDYEPIRWLAWLVVLLVAGAGVFAGLNTMYGSVVGRISELSMLQTLGFARRAVVVSLMQEAMILSFAASLFAALLAIPLVNGSAVRFTMGAFQLQIDSVAVLIGCGVGLSLGFFGSIPPAIRALKMSVVDGLRSV
ncbi:MAG: putative ABC transport system permease protein, partial [Mariniblastus sp.]